MKRGDYKTRGIGGLLVLIALAVPAMAADDAQWTEVRSPNFRVITDAGATKGRAVALRFEEIRAVFGALTGDPQVRSAAPLEIIAFRRTKEFAQTAAPLYNGRPIKASGVFVGGDDRNFIALDLAVHDPWRVPYHEYAHLLLDANFPGAQAWFDEGFASYYESLEIAGAAASLGRDPARHVPRLLRSRLLPVTELFALTQKSREYNEGDRGSFYAQAWLAVHYLIDTDRLAQASRYFELLERERLPIAQAIERAFAMTPAQFDRALEEYLRLRQMKIKRVERPSGLDQLEFAARALDEWDARAVIADMRLHHPDYGEAAAQEFQQILAARPEHAVAHRGLGFYYLHRGEYARAEKHLRRSAAADGSEPYVHYYRAMLAPLAGKGRALAGEMKQSLRKALALKPDLADAYNLLAFAHGLEQEYPEAVAAMKQALALAPREEKYRDALARYYLQLQQWDDAEPLLRGLVESADEKIAAGAKERLEWLAKMRAESAAAPQQ